MLYRHTVCAVMMCVCLHRTAVYFPSSLHRFRLHSVVVWMACKLTASKESYGAEYCTCAPLPSFPQSYFSVSFLILNWSSLSSDHKGLWATFSSQCTKIFTQSHHHTTQLFLQPFATRGAVCKNILD